jgi:hypothetical protein
MRRGFLFQTLSHEVGNYGYRQARYKTHEFSGSERGWLYESPAQKPGGQSTEKGIEKITIKMIHASPWSLNEKSLMVKDVATVFTRDQPVKAIAAWSPVMRKYVIEQA